MNNQNGERRVSFYFWLILAIVVFVIFLEYNKGRTASGGESSYSIGELTQDLTNSSVADAVIIQNREVPTGSVRITLRDGSRRTLYVTDVGEAESLLRENHVDPEVRDVSPEGFNLMTWLPALLMIIFCVFFFVMMSGMQGMGGQGARMMNFGRSRARKSSPEDNKITMENVAGLAEEKEQLQEIITF